MRSLFAFSGGGGSGFPGSPVAGVYLPVSSPEFLTVCAAVVAVPASIVADQVSSFLIWFSNGSEMILFGGFVDDSSFLPNPGTQGGVVFIIPPEVAIYDNSTGVFFYFDGSDWQALSGN